MGVTQDWQYKKREVEDHLNKAFDKSLESIKESGSGPERASDEYRKKMREAALLITEALDKLS